MTGIGAVKVPAISAAKVQLSDICALKVPLSGIGAVMLSDIGALNVQFSSIGAVKVQFSGIRGQIFHYGRNGFSMTAETVLPMTAETDFP